MNATLVGRARRLALPLAGVAALVLAVSLRVIGNSRAVSRSANAGPVAAPQPGRARAFADVGEARPAAVDIEVAKRAGKTPAVLGGPVFAAAGRALGINAALYSSSGGNAGVGFAGPSGQARAIIAQLKKAGSASRAWLGVQVRNLDHNVADSLGLDNTRGALISEVQNGGPADAAGVHAGDVIVGFDGKPVGSAKALTRIVGNTPADRKVSVTVWRDGRKRKLWIRVRSAADPGGRGADAAGPRGRARTRSVREALGAPRPAAHSSDKTFLLVRRGGEQHYVVLDAA